MFLASPVVPYIWPWNLHVDSGPICTPHLGPSGPNEPTSERPRLPVHVQRVSGLAAHGITPSMSKRDDCYDNTVAESFSPR